MNVADGVVASAETWPESAAVLTTQCRLSYRDLVHRADALAEGLARIGLTRGDAVATFAGNCVGLVVFELACYKAGLPRVPVNARLSRGELHHIVRNSGAQLLVVDAEHAAAATGLPIRVLDISTDLDALVDPAGPSAPVRVDVATDSPAVLHFTSGSTGALKAAVQTVGNRLAMIEKFTACEDVRMPHGDRVLFAGPITHASGKMLLGALSNGGCAVVMERFTTGEWFDLVERERVTTAFVVPTMLTRLMDDPSAQRSDLSSLDRIVYGAAPMSPAGLRRAQDVFGCDFVQAYGCGETTSVVTVLGRADHHAALAGDEELFASCGRAVFATEVAVVDECGVQVAPGETGEIVVRGADVVPGYWNAPQLTADNFHDGWFWTGDIGRMRADGYFFVVDRKKDMIISGGFNIYAVEVESALAAHPGVQEVAVVGVPHPTWGEAVKAVVVPRPGSTVGEDELISFCADRLARMKKPQSVDLVEELPHNANGKLDRKSVRARYWAGAERLVG